MQIYVNAFRITIGQAQHAVITILSFI